MKFLTILLLTLLTIHFIISCSEETVICKDNDTITYIGEGSYLNKNVTLRVDIFSEISSSLTIIPEGTGTFSQGGYNMFNKTISFDVVPANNIFTFKYNDINSLGLLKNNDDDLFILIKQ